MTVDFTSTTPGATKVVNGRTYTLTDGAWRAAAIITATITNGDTSHAPSGDAVFDALAAKSGIAPRVTSLSSASTVTPNADAEDLLLITGQAAALTLANPSGTPASGQVLRIRINDNGSARAISYGSQYRALDAALPTTTAGAGATRYRIYLTSTWNAEQSLWDTRTSQQI